MGGALSWCEWSVGIVAIHRLDVHPDQPVIASDDAHLRLGSEVHVRVVAIGELASDGNTMTTTIARTRESTAKFPRRAFATSRGSAPSRAL
ncbi:hypothetical protein PLANTIT3_30168 [Plantibacter sp. T3]|nr:hypothetical protein PLANTIT3_30168 [Plantibacter sp. T3]